MFSCFKESQKEEETSVSFLENGSSLLQELVGSFSGRYRNPIRCFTAKELINATNSFTVHAKFLRNGGNMFAGFVEEQPILVKKNCDEFSSSSFHGAIRDIAVTSQMSHLKNVLKLRGCCLEFRCPALVYEYAGSELLADLLHYSDGKKLLSLRNRLQIAKGIANAIAYLHAAFPTTIVYRNLKPSNVIIDKDGIPKLFDFSLSISLPRGKSQVEDVVMGTWGFVDPEYLETSVVTEKTDVYSFGVLLLVLLTGKEVMCRNGGEMIDIVDYVKHRVGNSQFNCILDSKMTLDKDVNHGIQFHSLFNLALECTKERGEDRPDMINVAKTLYRIERSASHC